jgi:hypothetical protein
MPHSAAATCAEIHSISEPLTTLYANDNLLLQLYIEIANNTSTFFLRGLRGFAPIFSVAKIC